MRASFWFYYLTCEKEDNCFGIFKYQDNNAYKFLFSMDIIEIWGPSNVEGLGKGLPYSNQGPALMQLL